MDYRKIATEVIDCIGGKDNIVSAAHCATRLRLVIADDSKVKNETLEQIDGVKGVFAAQGQLQIIIGTGTVNKVYDEFVTISGIETASKEDVKKAAAQKQNIVKRGLKTLGDIFVPIIPAIVASGLLMGLLEGLCNVWPAMANSGTYQIIHLFSNAAFVFLPILIAISAARVFGGNIFLGAVIGMIMIHTGLINAWSVSSMKAADIPTASVWFGLFDIRLVGYQGHVIPVIIAVWLMSTIEKKLHKIVPEIIDLFVTPLVTVLVTGYVTLTVIGPVFSTVENWVLSGAETLITLPLGIGSALAAAFYAPTVVAGLHHMYNALEAGLLSKNGVNTWMPIATAANVAQGAAALAVAIKTKNMKTKAMALPASLSAFLGITEPAIFGVNIRYGTPFIAGCIGGAAGGLVAGLLHIGASAYGITGFFGFLITTGYTAQYALLIVISSSIAFAISWTLYKEKSTQVENTNDVNSPNNEITSSEASNKVEAKQRSEKTINSPMNGTLFNLSEVNDESFSKEMLGKGFAILPEEGKVYAPFDGTADMVFETGHALGISSETGEEILIHVGLDTVNLEGKYYTPKVNSGDSIKKGQLLLEFDLEKIKEAGYDVITPVILTNSDNYETFVIEEKKSVKAGEKVMVVA
ncbi:PTS beta-glucoside transporter subunit IIBCA [Anaeromicropila herbilytica]|uniref:PTS beta-glucoside transporter subunit EIIBCA n=1 Tax=Anaeromicropila herbilytica TaxID=2785025 RepID=A0A7R7EIE6_9FIRM|nr:PTS beta-glucoside transporter subunit IIBCA [Anaeromicropila herbilytica]BCN29304.1 PTS beta-glucoside transporter subunit EIIBCA [Anaeromicropila herbilytica]